MSISNENLSSYSELLDSEISIIKNILSDDCNLEFDNNNNTNIENEFLAFFDDVGGPEMPPSPIIHNNIESDEDNFSSAEEESEEYEEEYLEENFEDIDNGIYFFTNNYTVCIMIKLYF